MASIFERLKHSSMGMVGMAVISTTVLVLGYKLFWRPRQVRCEKREAEMIPNFVFETENKE